MPSWPATPVLRRLPPRPVAAAVGPDITQQPTWRNTLGPGHWHTARPFVATGGVAVVVGGLVAAANASVATENGSWTAAYLVLVVGVAQIGLGAGQSLLVDPVPTVGRVAFEYFTLNGGNLGVLVGTLLGVQPVVDLGSVALVVALITFLVTVPRRWTPWPFTVYRLLIAIVLASVPIGVVLSRLNATP